MDEGGRETKTKRGKVELTFPPSSLSSSSLSACSKASDKHPRPSMPREPRRQLNSTRSSRRPSIKLSLESRRTSRKGGRRTRQRCELARIFPSLPPSQLEADSSYSFFSNQAMARLAPLLAPEDTAKAKADYARAASARTVSCFLSFSLSLALSLILSLTPPLFMLFEDRLEQARSLVR